jgi:hypothetical protein
MCPLLQAHMYDFTQESRTVSEGVKYEEHWLQNSGSSLRPTLSVRAVCRDLVKNAPFF